MYRHLTALGIGLFVGSLLSGSPARCSASVLDDRTWINELHYDNVGSDIDEFIEIIVAVDQFHVAELSLTFYNGSSGRAYRGPIGGEEFNPGERVAEFQVYWYESPLQNGSPDGVALAAGNQVLQFLSYEGTFTATDGVALGLQSTDIGVSEPNDTPTGLALPLTGVGTSYHDFVWADARQASPGRVNIGQSLAGPAVPNPPTWLIWSALVGLTGLIRSRRTRRRMITRLTA